MLVDKPGIKYLLNEALLNQESNDMSIAKARKDGNSIAGAVLKQVKYTTQLVGSTLAQVPVNGTGLHFVKGFRTDTYLQPTNQEDISGFAQFFGAGGVEGAQYALRGEIVPGDHKTELLIDTRSSNFDYIGGDVFIDRNEVLNKELPENVDYRQTKLNAESGTVIKVQPEEYNETTATKGQLAKYTTSSYGAVNAKATQPETFGPIPTGWSEINTYTSASRSIPTFNKDVRKESRVLLGDQGAFTSDKKQTARRLNDYSFMSDSGDEVDQMNAIGVKKLKVDGNNDGRDIVKFRFHIITPEDEHILYFRAFLDSFNDNYTGTWNPTKYLGRAEDFQVYSGFQRKISLSFKIAAATRSEMKPIYQKMIWLASATAPSYSDNGQFMRGTIIKVTVGDYIYELPGVLNNLTYTWQQDYPWEIAMLEPESRSGDYNMQELPMVMDCQMEFTPIHTFTPEVGLKKYFTAGTRSENKYVPD
jgi:hypothetical protein